MTKQEISPQRQLWTLIFDIADKLRDGFVDEQLEHEELFHVLTVRQHKTIRAISILTEEKSEGITLKELAEYLKLAPCSVSETVEALVKLGVLDRAINPYDRRAVLITLSANALKAREAGIGYLNRNAEKVLQQMTTTEKDLFMKVLEKFYQSIHNGK